MIITAGHWKSNPAGQSGGRDSRHAQVHADAERTMTKLRAEAARERDEILFYEYFHNDNGAASVPHARPAGVPADSMPRPVRRRFRVEVHQWRWPGHTCASRRTRGRPPHGSQTRESERPPT